MLIKLLIGFSIFLHCLPCENHQIDESHEHSAAEQIEALIEAARGNCEKPAEKLEFIEKAIRLSRDLGDEEMVFRAAVERVGLLGKDSQFEAALEMADIALSLERGITDRSIVGRLYLYKAVAQLNLGDTVTAIESLRYAKALEEGSPKQLAIINNYLGICLRDIGSEREALKALKLALKQSVEADFCAFDFAIRSNLASLLLSIGETDQAETHLKLILPKSIEQDKFPYIQVNLCLSEVALVRGEYDSARSLAQKAYDAVDPDTDFDFLVDKAFLGKLLIGRCYLAEKQYLLAREYCELAVERLQRNPSYGDPARLYLGLAIMGEGKQEQGLAIIKKVAKEAESAETRKKACEKLVGYFSTLAQFESALKYEKLLRTIDVEQMERQLRLVESRFQPQLMVNRLKMIASEEKTNLIAEKSNSEKAKMQAESSKREASTNRLIKNLVIFSSGIILLGGIFYFRSQIRIRQAIVEIIESRKRVELERQLGHKRRIESIGQLTGNVAHDFNNILQVVSSSNQLLESSIDESLTPLHRQLIASANDAVDIGARITSQLLSFAGKQPFAPQPTLATKVFENSALLFSSVGGDEVRIELEDLTPELVINVDRGQLSNALLNLLVNARRAMGGKGLVKIRLSQFTDERAFGTSEESPKMFLKIEVIDKGRGMSSEEIEKACDPYYTTKTSETGAGLGLSSVQGFVEQLDGWLEIESEEGLGTTVSLHIPARIENFLEAEQVSVHPSEFQITESARCLVVEDNPEVRSSLVAFLEMMEIECCCRCNADEAHSLLKLDSNFQIVISDIRMPGVWDGADLAQWIAVNASHISTILISGNEAPLHMENCMFLRKPFRFDELQKIIMGLLEASSGLSQPFSAQSNGPD